MAGWDDLSFETQCQILALVPLSTRKLALRFTSKAWAAVLDSSWAHSTSARTRAKEDSVIDHTVPLIMLKPLRSLRWAGGIQLPEMPHLRHLCYCFPLENEEELSPLPVAHFPRLQSLRLDTSSGLMERLSVDEMHSLLHPGLAALHNLQRFEYEAQYLTSVELPRGCQVSAWVEHFPTFVPPLTAKHLTSLELGHRPAGDEAFVLDLRVFAECALLVHLRLEVRTVLGWAVSGLDKLPSCLAAVEMVEYLEDTLPFDMPSFNTESVASIEMDDMGCKLFLRKQLGQ